MEPEMVGPLIVLGIPFGFFAFLRYIRYRETIALAEKGLVRPHEGANGRDALRWGLVITFVGVAMIIGLYPIGWMAAPGEFPFNFGPWMLLGLVPTAFGLALLVIDALLRRDDHDDHEEPPAA